MLGDGIYDALIIDGRVDNDDARVATLELTITRGDNKGDVVAVRVTDLARDPVDALGLPATLIVEHGVPRVEIEWVG